jgi:Tfp pilus assembly protein PilF
MTSVHRIVLVLIILISMSFTVPDEKDATILNDRGLDELRNGKPALAAGLFLKAISIDPSRKYFYNNLASAYMRMGEYLKAELYLKKSIALDNNYARALSNMSVTLFHLGRYRESYSYYLQSLKADPEYTEKRFEKNRVVKFIKKFSGSRPEDKTLKRINEYLDSGEDVKD